MRDKHNKFRNHRFIFLMIYSIMILFSLGCNLFSANYWVHRLDETESALGSESFPTTTTIIAESRSDLVLETKCLDSPGTDPCPIDACVVDTGQYSAKNEVTSELFGKANPSDYQCCAEFQFTNNSGEDLMGFEHHITENTDNWYFKLYPAANPDQSIYCLNNFTRKDGKEVFNKGVTEIVILFANPHCDWIQWDEPGLVNYRIPVVAGCYSNE